MIYGRVAQERTPSDDVLPLIGATQVIGAFRQVSRGGILLPEDPGVRTEILRWVFQRALHEGPAALGEGAAHFGLLGNGLRGAGKLVIEIDGRIGLLRLRDDQAVN